MAWAAVARGGVPVVDYFFPPGGQRGTSVSVTAAGKFDQWPIQGWSDSPAIHVVAGKSKGTFTFQIDPNAPVGPHLMRFYGDDGSSALRCFVVGAAAETLEAEPNDEPRTAQAVSSLPVTINGQLDKSGDVDCYAVNLEAGSCLVASLQGRRLGSSMDPMLHLIDPDGVECAFAHDGLGLDPQLDRRVEKPGRYVVRVSAFAYPPAADVKLAGGKGDIYRLHLTTGPAARFCMPSGVARKEKGQTRLLGWNLPPSGTGSEIAIDPSLVSPLESYLFVPAPGADQWLRLEVSDAPEWLDREARKEDVVVPVPVNISGQLPSPGEEHRYKIAATKGEALRLIVRNGALNSTLDAVVRLESGEGKQLARANGTAVSSDVSLDWTAPAEGAYFAVVSDLFGKGGPGAVYRLEIKRPTPTVTASLDGHAYRVVAGKTAIVKMNVARKDGHAGGLVAIATGLPSGVTATSADIPAKGGEVSLTLTAAATAKPANGVVRFLIVGTDAGHPEVYAAQYGLRQEKDVIQEWIEQTDAAWLTVVAAPATTAPTGGPAPGAKPAGK